MRTGQVISFDGLMVDEQGIRHHRGSIPWPDIVAIGVTEGITSTKVTVRTGGRRRAYGYEVDDLRGRGSSNDHATPASHQGPAIHERLGQKQGA